MDSETSAAEVVAVPTMELLVWLAPVQTRQTAPTVVTALAGLVMALAEQASEERGP